MIIYAVLFDTAEYTHLEEVFDSREKALDYILSQGKYEPTKIEGWYVENPSKDMYEIKVMRVQ